MKKTVFFLLCSIFLYASAQNFDAQIGEYKKQAPENMPPNSNRTWASKQTSQSPIWAPCKGVEYRGSDTSTPYYFIHYKHSKEGRLLSEYRDPNKEHPYDDYPIRKEYNGTFLIEGKDVIDTITIYQKNNHSIPLERTYYNYHYYDTFEQDSFYVDEIIQVWNNRQKKWIDDYRYRYQFADTVYWGFRGDETYNSRGSGNLVQTSGMRQTLEYDDQGNVSKYINYSYNEETSVYEEFASETYLYDDEGVMREIIYYYSNNMGGWNAIAKETDIEWKEWHGYICFSRIGVGSSEFYMPYEQIIGDKRNKKSSSTTYTYKNARWEKSSKYEYDWNINGTLSNKYTTFLFIDDENFYKGLETSHLWDERGNFVTYRLAGYTMPDENGEQNISFYGADYHLYTYDEEKGCLKEYNHWNPYMNTDTHVIDTNFQKRIIITDFIDATTVGMTEIQDTGYLLLYPNPAREIIYISAAEPIEQINLYDLTGRLLKEDYPKAQQTELPVGNLAPGAYLLKARLKNGAVKVEKVIVR